MLKLPFLSKKCKTQPNLILEYVLRQGQDLGLFQIPEFDQKMHDFFGQKWSVQHSVLKQHIESYSVSQQHERRMYKRGNWDKCCVKPSFDDTYLKAMKASRAQPSGHSNSDTLAFTRDLFSIPVRHDLCASRVCKSPSASPSHLRSTRKTFSSCSIMQIHIVVKGSTH